MGEFGIDAIPDSHTLCASPVSLPPFTDHLDNFGPGDPKLDALDVQWRGSRWFRQQDKRPAILAPYPDRAVALGNLQD